MFLPKAFLGFGLPVAKRMRRLASLLGTSQGLEDKQFGEFVDIANYSSSMLLLDQVNRRDQGEHFHCYSLFTEAEKASTVDDMRRWVGWFLVKPWRYTSVAGPAIANFLLLPGFESLQKDYLRAALAFGPELEALGSRFQFILSRGTFSTSESGAGVLLFKHGKKYEYQRPGALFEALKEYLSA